MYEACVRRGIDFRSTPHIRAVWPLHGMPWVREPCVRAPPSASSTPVKLSGASERQACVTSSCLTCAARGAAEDDFYYTRLAGYIIPCGFSVIPFIDTSVTRLGTIGCCQMVNVMGILYNCTSLVPSLRIQVFTAAVYTVYRAFVFSMISTFNAQVC